MIHNNLIPSWYLKTQDRINCQYCNKELSRRRLAKHIDFFHNKDPTKSNCEFCKKTFPSIKLLRKHEKIDHLNKSQKCEFCENSYIHKKSLQSHIREKHTNPKTSNPMIAGNCDLCGKCFASQKFLSNHKQIYHRGGKQNKCDLCGKLYFHRKGLKKHIEEKHSEKEPKENANEIVCSLCNNMFQSIPDFEKHLSESNYHGKKE